MSKRWKASVAMSALVVALSASVAWRVNPTWAYSKSESSPQEIEAAEKKAATATSPNPGKLKEDQEAISMLLVLIRSTSGKLGEEEDKEDEVLVGGIWATLEAKNKFLEANKKLSKLLDRGNLRYALSASEISSLEASLNGPPESLPEPIPIVGDSAAPMDEVM